MSRLAKNLAGIVWLTRPVIVLTSLLTSIAAFKILHQDMGSLRMLALTLTLAAGYVQNDLADIEDDRISAPYRPLPNNTVSLAQAKLLRDLLWGIAAVVLFWTELLFYFYCIAYSFAFIEYSRSWRKSRFTKNITTVIWFSSVAIIPMLLLGNSTVASWRFVLSIATFTYGREVLMDARDDLPRADVSSGDIKRRALVGFLIALLGFVGVAHITGTALFFMFASVFLCVEISLFIHSYRRAPLWRVSEGLKFSLLVSLFIFLFTKSYFLPLVF